MKNIFLSTLVLTIFYSASSFSQDYGDYYFDEVIVRISDNAGMINIQNDGSNALFGIPSLDKIAQKIGASKIDRLFPRFDKPSDPYMTDLSRIYTVHFPLEADLFRVIDDFQQNPYIIYAEPYYIRKTTFTPNDPSIGQQYALTNIQAYQAWDYSQGSPNAKICIVDTGIDIDHPDLVANLWVNPGEDLNGNGVIEPAEINNIDDEPNGFIDDFYGWDFVGNDNNPDDNATAFGGHGSHTSGIASAVTNNNIGIAGTGFNASIITARAGSGLFITAPYEGVSYGIENGADIISMSWGGGGYSQTEQNMFNYADEQGILCIAAAGNNNSSAVFYPANYNNVISVAATNETDLKASFSNYGSWIDLSAPGDNIYSTYLNAGYTMMDGTSMACPMVAGLASLVKAAYPDFQADAIGLILRITADNIDGQNPAYVGMLGWGRINAYKAMSMLYSNASLTLTPLLPQIQIPASGGQFLYDRLIQNSGTADRTVNVHTVAVLPNGTYYRISVEPSLILPAGGQIQNLNLSQTIPAGAPAGSYSYITLALDAASRSLVAMDYFTFVKTAALDNSAPDQAWELSLSEGEISETSASAPDRYELAQPYPNPFNPETTLSFSLPQSGQVSLKVYDLQGRQVAVLSEGWKDSGVYEMKFDGSALSSGIYFAVLKARNFQQVRKLTLIK